MPDTKTVGAHNSIWRGEELLSASHFGQYENALESLAQAVNRGDFTDIYVGDTITVTMDAISGYEATSQTVVWVVMGINIYYNNGHEMYRSNNHLVLVPKDALGSMTMNSTPTSGKSDNLDNPSNLQAYAGSDMAILHLPAYETAIRNSLGGHILPISEFLSNKMDATKTSGGFSGYSGASSDWHWYEKYISLLSEVEVYGTRIASSSMYDVGNRCIQLPGFSLNPALKIKGLRHGGARCDWWLSAVADSEAFVIAGYDGGVYREMANDSNGIVPKVLFG